MRRSVRSSPQPPHPDLVRRPTRPFGWLEHGLLHDGWLARLGPDPIAVLVLLALAADRRGASYYGRDRMARELSMNRPQVNQALERLLHLRLVAHRPYQPDHPDGVWQLLPIATPDPTTRRRTTARPLPLAQILASLGLPASTR